MCIYGPGGIYSASELVIAIHLNLADQAYE